MNAVGKQGRLGEAIRCVASVSMLAEGATMDAYWIPGVNHLEKYGRWAFAEFTDVYEMEADFETKIEYKFNEMIQSIAVSDIAKEANG